MPQTAHVEKHFTGGQTVRDVVIGMADGLTVPFALAAGLSTAVGSTQIVVLAGLAEVAAGAIAMGLGGYLAARGDAEHYAAERQREEQEIVERPAAERQEIFDLLKEYGVRPDQASGVVDAIQASPSAWVDFMMRFELGLEWAHPSRAAQQRPDHRGVVCNRRTLATDPLHPAGRHAQRADRIGDCHAFVAADLRLCQGPFRKNNADTKCAAHNTGGCIGCRRSVPDRAVDFITRREARKKVCDESIL